jgi:hypothetical protein
MMDNKMNKSEFKLQAEPFVNWLSKHLDENNSANDRKKTKQFHQWTALSNRAAPKKGVLWECTSVYCAYENYYWKTNDPLNNKVITSLSENESCLDALKKRLHDAIKTNDADQCLDTCEKILQWGGVERYKVATLIRSRLGKALPSYLQAICTFLSNQNLTTDCIFNFNDGNENYELEVDSGTTKIYSLLAPNWIIYDGRVGAALGFLVNKWANEEKTVIPDVLKFSWGYEQRRNPNTDKKLIFPKFGSGIDRFKHNLYANWLCNHILALNLDNPFKKTSRPDRALEAALFMIGYCVRQSDKKDDNEAYDSPIGLPFTIDNQGIIEKICARFGDEEKFKIPQQKGKAFVATLTEAGILVDNLGSCPFLPWEVFTETVQFLKNQNGCAKRGNGMKKLGSEELPFDSVEGHIAQYIYNKKIKDSVFRRISPIANILVWAGICQHGNGKLSLLPNFYNA